MNGAEVLEAVVFGSFDAERSWRPDDAATLPTVPDRQAARIVAGLDEVLAPICGAGDLLITRAAASESASDAVAQVLDAAGLRVRRLAVARGAGDAESTGEQTIEQLLVAAADELRPGLRGLQGLRAKPYAVTHAVAEACAALGLRWPGDAAPDPQGVARVNSKVWSNDLVIERGFAGAARRVRSVRELRDAVADMGLPVVVKDPYGVAGQGAIRVAEPGTLDSVSRHLARQVARGRGVDLLVQPLFSPGHDFSAHFDIAADGTVVFTGLCETLNEGFAYRGSRPMSRELARRVGRLGYLEAAREAAVAVADTGYRGPVCVDSMLTGAGTLVPVLEINARMSMGLVALNLARVLGPAAVGEGEVSALQTELRQRTVLPSDDRAYERVAETLRERGLLATAERPGVLPLAAAPLVPPRGRLVYGLSGGTAEDRAALDAGLARVLDDLGMLPPGGVRAA